MGARPHARGAGACARRRPYRDTRSPGALLRFVDLALAATRGIDRTFWLDASGLGHLYELARPWPTRPGYRCVVMRVATGGILLFALLVAWRRVDPMSPAATGAAFGAGAGLGSALLIDLWCPVSYLPHLLVGHVLPIAFLAAAGTALGRRILSAVSSR